MKILLAKWFFFFHTMTKIHFITWCLFFVFFPPPTHTLEREKRSTTEILTFAEKKLLLFENMFYLKTGLF